MHVSLEWGVELADGTEVMYDIECDVTPYDPGVCSGPPEKCYPPEGGEVEILSIKLQGLGKQPGIEVKEPIWHALGFSKDVLERIEEAAGEKAADYYSDPPDRDDD